MSVVRWLLQCLAVWVYGCAPKGCSARGRIYELVSCAGGPSICSHRPGGGENVLGPIRVGNRRYCGGGNCMVQQSVFLFAEDV